MNEHPSTPKLFSVAELCESIKDDLAEIEVLESEFGAAEADQADMVMRAAIAQALAASAPSIRPSITQNPPATMAAKITASHALTDPEYDTLLQWATDKVAAFKGNASDVDAEDVMHEALVQALKDNRKWYPQEIPFPTFVGDCIRTTALNRLRDRDTVAAATLVFPSKETEQLNIKITLNVVRNRLSERPAAIKMFDLQREDLSGPQIREILAIDQREFDALRASTDRHVKAEIRRVSHELFDASNHDYYRTLEWGLYGFRKWARHYTELLNQYEWLLQWERPETERTQGRVEQARVVVEVAIAEAQGEDIVKKIVDRILALRDKSIASATPDAAID